MYILALALATGIWTGYALLTGSVPAGRLPVALALAGLMVLVNLFPIHFGFKTKLTLDSAVTLAAILLFPTGVAMLIAGGGSLLAHLSRRNGWDEVLFNGSQSALLAGTGATVLAAAGWTPDQLLLSDPQHVVAILLSVIAVHVMNAFLMATMIGLESRQSLPSLLRQLLGADGMEQVLQVSLGILTAVIADSFPWALLLLLVPSTAAYRASRRQSQMLRQPVEAVESLTDIVDARSPYTVSHSARVAVLASGLARELGLSDAEIEVVELAARFHDIGKVVVDTRLLTKPEELGPDEWEQLKAYPAAGAEILGRFPQFNEAASYVRHHHEHFDGRGYPDGLSGERIPLGARIIAVADSYDAMTHSRPYRSALPREVALAELRKGRGVQWDARVVDALLSMSERQPAPETGEKLAEAPQTAGTWRGASEQAQVGS